MKTIIITAILIVVIIIAVYTIMHPFDNQSKVIDDYIKKHPQEKNKK